MIPTLTRPEIKRGSKEAWPEMARPYLDPTHLRPGVDVLQLAREIPRRRYVLGKGRPTEYILDPIPCGTRVLFLGHAAGSAIVAYRHESGPLRVVEVAPDDLIEDERLGEGIPRMLLHQMEFSEGYEEGHWEALSARPVGTRSQRRIPSWFGRGISAGHRDRMSGRDDLTMNVTAAWNRELRMLAAVHPREHSCPVPRRGI